MSDFASASDRLAVLLARVAAARASGGANGAVTDADVRWLADLPIAEREDALAAVAAAGASKSALKARIKPIAQTSRLRVAGEEGEDAWLDRLRRNDQGDPLALLDTAVSILRHAYGARLSFDAMALRPHLDGRPMGDRDVTRLRAEIGATYRCTPQATDFLDALGLVASESREFHPVQDYLRGLTWDGRPRLWTMARTHLGLGDAYSNRILGRVMVAGVARGLLREHAPEAGVLVKTIPIILGHQDARKSTFWRTLGAPWFLDSRVNIEERSGSITLATKWWVEFPEIDGLLSRASNESTKAWTAQYDDTFIPVYGRAPITTPRTFLIVATTNKDRFLTDPTGSARWLVLDTRPNGPEWEVDIDALAEERDQLFAEAVVAFDAYLVAKAAGERDNPHRWWMSKTENRERASRNEAHQVEHGWTDTLAAWLAGAEVQCVACKGSGGHGGGCPPCAGSGRVTRGELPRDPTGRDYVTLEQLRAECLGVPVERWKTREKNEVADALAAIHWRPGQIFYPRLPGGRAAKSKVTPYYCEADPATAEELASAGVTPAEAARRLDVIGREAFALESIVERGPIPGEGEGA